MDRRLPLAASVLLLFGLAAAPALAHDPADCALELEAECDEVATDPSDWLGCALLVADICSEHVDPASAASSPDVIIAHPVGGTRDRVAFTRFQARLALWQFLYPRRPMDLPPPQP